MICRAASASSTMPPDDARRSLKASSRWLPPSPEARSSSCVLADQL
eukprot:CAMPEP_0115859278 /NCGR_PEP_ID=MMETSP0287-20121206/16533_1 /TAXON_ID=412157 /ORGANISM="Chrysochromulina rotalis, Strain UIO044" /LENGTH=45 /DNA_ID= /DNA_START= /DNA_END= /DNA_ORIENTATION=